jgi:hypothetical protein
MEKIDCLSDCNPGADRTAMIAYLFRYLAALLTAAADWIATPKTPPRGMNTTMNKCRKRKNDVFLTPVEVARDHIGRAAQVVSDHSECAHWGNDSVFATGFKWVDPFRNTGVYYNNFPTKLGTTCMNGHIPMDRDWCELLQGRDALEYDYTDAIVCSNPPYSLLAPLLKKMTDDRAEIISLLIGVMNLTTPRLEKMRLAGYHVMDMTLYNVKGYMGTSVAVTWARAPFPHSPAPDATLNWCYKKGGFKVNQEEAMR